MLKSLRPFLKREYMQSKPEEIKKSHTAEVETIDTLQEKLHALKMSNFTFQKDFILKYKKNELDMMESLLIEKFCNNKEFKNIENIIFKNSNSLVDIYLPEYINNPIYVEKYNTILKSIGFLMFIVTTFILNVPIFTNFLGLSSFIPEFLYSIPVKFTSMTLLAGFFIYLRNSSLTFSKLTGFLYSFFSILIPGLYNKFKLSRKMSKKLSTEDMIKVTKLFVQEQVAYAQNYLLQVGKEKDVSNLSIGVEKIIKNIESCFKKIENNQEDKNYNSSVFISCLTIIEYGLMVKFTCNNYDRYLNYQNEVFDIERKISHKLKAENHLENIYKKL